MLTMINPKDEETFEFLKMERCWTNMKKLANEELTL